jgi:hypothetical protein
VLLAPVFFWGSLQTRWRAIRDLKPAEDVRYGHQKIKIQVRPPKKNVRKTRMEDDKIILA